MHCRVSYRWHRMKIERVCEFLERKLAILEQNDDQLYQLNYGNTMCTTVLVVASYQWCPVIVTLTSVRRSFPRMYLTKTKVVFLLSPGNSIQGHGAVLNHEDEKLESKWSEKYLKIKGWMWWFPNTIFRLKLMLHSFLTESYWMFIFPA